MNFEVIAVGFDGATDATDDRIIWVTADEDYLTELLAGVPYLECNDLPTEYKLCADFTLPQDSDALVERLNHFARNLP